MKIKITGNDRPNESSIRLVANKLNEAIGHKFFLVYGECGCIRARASWGNNDYDRIVGAFLLICHKFIYFVPDKLEFRIISGYTWNDVWNQIQNFDFQNIEVEVN